MASSESGELKAKEAGDARSAARRTEKNERAWVGMEAPDQGTYLRTFLVAKVLPSWGAACCAPTGSDAAGDVGEVEPDFYAAEVGAFGADGGGDAGAEVARGADVAGELRMDFAELGYFVKRGFVDFFLGVEAGAHGPFVEQMKERAGFDEADGLGVGEKIERNFDWHAAVEELIFCGPGFLHRAFVDFFGARIVGNEQRQDVIRLASVCEREEWSRTGDHAVALVLAVRRVADFFRKRISGVLQGAHHWGVGADVESFQAVEVASGIQEPVDRFGIAALRFGKADDGTISLRDDVQRAGRVVHELGGFAAKLGVELARERIACDLRRHRVFPFR